MTLYVLCEFFKGFLKGIRVKPLMVQGTQICDDIRDESANLPLVVPLQDVDLAGLLLRRPVHPAHIRHGEQQEGTEQHDGFYVPLLTVFLHIPHDAQI